VIEKLIGYLKDSKAYLNPELTIGDIGKEIDVPVHQLSKALNQYLKKNFYQFINEYRVEEAMRLLSDDSLSGRSVLSIGMDSGFSTKSTFNEAFKKLSGHTPSDFRKRQILAQEPNETTNA
jgi:AraC-like DNA-binding protein